MSKDSEVFQGARYGVGGDLRTALDSWGFSLLAPGSSSLLLAHETAARPGFFSGLKGFDVEKESDLTVLADQLTAMTKLGPQ